MGSLERRLERLEAAQGVPRPDKREAQREEALRREVLRRFTDEEHNLYAGVLERFEVAGDLSDDDLPILRRVEELTAEVRGQLA